MLRHLRRAWRPASSLRPIVTIKKFNRPSSPPFKASAPPLQAVVPTPERPPSSLSIKSDATPSSSIRVTRVIAQSGVCSRRAAEKLIGENAVKLNGELVTSPSIRVDPSTDVLLVHNRRIGPSTRCRVYMAHKLRGELITADDPQQRNTIFSRLQRMGLTQHLMPIGRLDYNTEGLLLLTNDGDYARKMEHPKTAMLRVYRVLVHGQATDANLARLQRGLWIEGVKYRPITATVHSRMEAEHEAWLQVRLHEGKNREVRKVLKHIGLVVKRLVRVQFGPYRLADLPAGAVLQVQAKPVE